MQKNSTLGWDPNTHVRAHCAQWTYTGGHGGGSLKWWISVPNTKVSNHSAVPLLRKGQEGILEPPKTYISLYRPPSTSFMLPYNACDLQTLRG